MNRKHRARGNPGTSNSQHRGLLWSLPSGPCRCLRPSQGTRSSQPALNPLPALLDDFTTLCPHDSFACFGLSTLGSGLCCHTLAQAPSDWLRWFPRSEPALGPLCPGTNSVGRASGNCGRRKFLSRPRTASQEAPGIGRCRCMKYTHTCVIVCMLST